MIKRQLRILILVIVIVNIFFLYGCKQLNHNEIQSNESITFFNNLKSLAEEDIEEIQIMDANDNTSILTKVKNKKDIKKILEFFKTKTFDERNEVASNPNNLKDNDILFYIYIVPTDHYSEATIIISKNKIHYKFKSYQMTEDMINEFVNINKNLMETGL